MTLNKLTDFSTTTEAKAFAEAISFRKSGDVLFSQQAPAAKATTPSAAA